MATIRQRPASKKDPSPPLYSVAKLSAEVKQIKHSAIEKEVSLKELKDQLKIPSRPKAKKISANKTSTSPLWSTLLLCYRVMVLLSLTYVVFYLFIMFSPSITSLLLKYVHTRLYYIIRPLRMGIATVSPLLLNTFGLDLMNTDCFVENPFVSEANFCPCLRVKLPNELQLTVESPTLPDSIFQLPTYDIFIARNALDTSNFTVEAFRDFKRNHPTHRGPKTCLKLTTNTEAGVQKMSDLYDPELLELHLNADTAWAFSWEECPTEERQQTFRDVYPQPEYLPPDIELLSDVTLFTLSTQWAQLMYNEASFPSGSLVATLVLLGEVRFSMDQIHEECLEHCSPFREQVVLKAGDVLLYDQRHWGYMAVTWSKQALTTTMAVFKPSPK